MAELKNCMLPDELLYHVDFNVWIHKNDDGTIDLGMTDIAQSLACLLYTSPSPRDRG